MAAHDFPILEFSTGDASPIAKQGLSRKRINKIKEQHQTTSSIEDFKSMSVVKELTGCSHPQSRNHRRHQSSLQVLKSYFAQKTWTIPLLLLLLILGLYAIDPTVSNLLHPFVLLSYKQPARSPSSHLEYGKGPLDLAFITFYTLLLTVVRELITHEFLHPLSIYVGVPPKKRTRFTEQAYTALYFSLSSILGLYILSETPLWNLDTKALYNTYPLLTHTLIFKSYYLLQASYWTSQALIMVLGLEAPRSDFQELVIHHICTLSLISLSYGFHFTMMGLCVFVTHDISDFFLAVSKSLHYIGSTIMPVQFGITILVWLYTRHYLNLRILWSVITEFGTVGPYGLDWENQQYKCGISRVVILVGLGVLQGLNLFWVGCLGRSAWRFLSRGEAKDERSEDEGGDEDEGM